jgi:2-dehydro-3-deoxyphosphooctonate aldolase (KDO 8-P synthase)
MPIFSGLILALSSTMRAFMSAPNSIVSAGSVQFGNDLPLSIMAGPCQMESRDHAMEMAAALKEIRNNLGIGIVYKSSFDKANRTSLAAARGIGWTRLLRFLPRLKRNLGCQL